MRTLWDKMTRIYGHKWSSMSECDDGTWLEGLRGYSPEDLASGLRGCLTRTDDWPPDLPEFRQLCRPAHVVTPACHKEYKSLPKPETDPDVVRRSIATIKGRLKYGPCFELPEDKPNPADEQIEKVKQTLKGRMV